MHTHPSLAFANTSFSETKTSTRGKTTRRATVSYDPDWHLCAETLWLHDQRWSDPPGSCWVRYVRRRDCFKVEPKPRPRRTTSGRVQVARFALDSSVLPLIPETLPVAEALRRSLMGIHGRLTEREGVKGRSAIFSGKDVLAKPLSGHRHAYYLPTDEDSDGRLDHLTLFAEAGFDTAEMRSIECLREIRPRNRENSADPLRVLLLSFGRGDDDQPTTIGPSSVWVSATPFISPKFPQRRGCTRHVGRSPEAKIAFLTSQVRGEVARWLERRAAPGVDPASVHVRPLTNDQGVFRIPNGTGNSLRPIQFKRFRSKRSDDGGRRPAGAFRLIFPSPVRGPLVLGHSAHFGMGLFIPERGR